MVKYVRPGQLASPSSPTKRRTPEQVVEQLQQEELRGRQEATISGAAEPASEREGIVASVTGVPPLEPEADSCNPAETVEDLGSAAELLKGPHETGDGEGVQPEASYEVGPWLPASQRCVRLSAAIQSVYNMVFQQVSMLAVQEMLGAVDSCRAHSLGIYSPTVSVQCDTHAQWITPILWRICAILPSPTHCIYFPRSLLKSALAVLGLLFPIQMSCVPS